MTTSLPATKPKRPCEDCNTPTEGSMRIRRDGWPGLLDRLRKRYIPLCVECARRVIIAHKVQALRWRP